MEWSLLSPAEQELRGLVRIVQKEDGTIATVDIHPQRCAELRAQIEAEEDEAFSALYPPIARA